MLLAQEKFLLEFLCCRNNSTVFSLWVFIISKRRGNNDVYKSPVIKDVMLLSLFYVSLHLLHITPSCELLSMLICTVKAVWVLWFDSAVLLVGMVTTLWNLFCESGGQHCTPVSTFLLLCDCSLWINESLGCLRDSSTYSISITLSTYQTLCAVSCILQQMNSLSHCVCSDTKGQ